MSIIPNMVGALLKSFLSSNMKNKISAFIPNALTLMNLLSAVLAILLQDIQLAMYFFVASLVFDVLDGWAARKLNVQSPLGVQLDSLADLVSFGVMPAFFLFQLYEEFCGYTALIVGLIPVAGAYRLGKFNLLEPSKYFKGLPIPSAAFFIMSIIFLSVVDRDLFVELLSSSFVLWLITLFVCFSMLSKVKLISLKGSAKERSILFGMIIPPVVLGIFFPIVLILIIPVYFLSGIVIRRPERHSTQ